MTSGIVPPARPENPPAKPISEADGSTERPGFEPRTERADAQAEGDGAAPRLPFCIECAEAFFNELEAQNDRLPEAEQESRPVLRFWAKVEAQKVRFFGEWVCPRCERVDVGPFLEPQLVPFTSVFANRESRRSFERWARTGHTDEEVR